MFGGFEDGDSMSLLIDFEKSANSGLPIDLSFDVI
jgi:hypothetical protein